MVRFITSIHLQFNDDESDMVITFMEIPIGNATLIYHVLVKHICSTLLQLHS